MTDVVLGIATEEPGKGATLLGEDGENRSIEGLVITMTGIRRTIVIWEKITVAKKSPLVGRNHRLAGLRMRKRKASEYRKTKKGSNVQDSDHGFYIFRISPRSHSPCSSAKEPVHPLSNTQAVISESTVLEMELDLPPSPPPVEDILAARRAKRQAILAKYTGAASVNTSISPSPGPSSAAQPPTPSLSVSNHVSQTLEANNSIFSTDIEMSIPARLSQ